MENKGELVVLYIDKKDGSYHQVLLNELEIQKISTEIANIFSAKRTAVMVSETKLKIVEEE